MWRCHRMGVGDDIHVLTTSQFHFRRPAGAGAKVERYRLVVDDEADGYVRRCGCALEREHVNQDGVGSRLGWPHREADEHVPSAVGERQIVALGQRGAGRGCGLGRNN